MSLPQGRDVHLAGARAVELAEEDALVAPERKVAALERNEHLRADEGRPEMSGSVRPVGVVVPPGPALVHDALERLLEVSDELRIDLLVDRHPGGGVRHVDERRRGVPVPAERGPYFLRD